MARIKRNEYSTKIWLSAHDTYEWAHKFNASWPCSQLSGKRLFAEFAANGDLIDIAINGRSQDCDASEFTALTDDFLMGKRMLKAND